MRKNFARQVAGISKLTSQEPFQVSSAVGSSNLAISAMSSSTGGETITNNESNASIIATFAASIPSTPDADIATNSVIIDHEPRDVLEVFFSASADTAVDCFVFAGQELHVGPDDQGARIKWVPWAYLALSWKAQAVPSSILPFAERYMSDVISTTADYTANQSLYGIGSGSPYTLHLLGDALGYCKFMFVFGAGAAISGPTVRVFYRGVS